MKTSFGAKTIVFPVPVWIVGTYDKDGKPSVMAASWGGVCCSEPPCITVSLRKATYTYGSLMERKAYTVSMPSEKYVKEADYFGIASGRNADKFADTGLTPVRSELVDAPYVDEFPFIIECKVIHIHEIGLHTQFIGQIMDVKFDEDVLDDNGKPEMDKIKPFVYTPSIHKYYGIGEYLGMGYDLGKSLKK